MSEKLPKESQNEEIDLGQLFNAIGRLFDRFFAFIGRLFKGLFSIIIYALKPIVNHIKIISIVVAVAAVLGFILDRSNQPVYTSKMLVKPYFDSKYELAENVDYFNNLIASSRLKELSNIFEIDTNSAKVLLGFNLKAGPETPNDLLIEYNAYLKNIDSTLAKDLTYDDYVKNRDILSSSIFAVSAFALENDIFPTLEKGFVKTFENRYSEKVKSLRNKTIALKVKNYKQELKRIDSIQNIYFEVIKLEAQDPNANLSISALPIGKEKQQTREYDLFREELKIRDSLIALEEQLVMENDYYDVVAGFEEIGTRDRSVIRRYFILFPLAAFALLVLGYVMFKSVKFIKEYE